MLSSRTHKSLCESPPKNSWPDPLSSVRPV